MPPGFEERRDIVTVSVHPVPLASADLGIISEKTQKSMVMDGQF